MASLCSYTNHYLSMGLQPFVEPWLVLFLDRLLCRYDPLEGDQTVARPLPAHKTAQTQNKRTQIPQVGFEPTILLFERAKTVHA
jgi:hypothetical protein